MCTFNARVWKIAFVRRRWSVSPLCVCRTVSRMCIGFTQTAHLQLRGWTPSRSAVTQTAQRSESKPNPGRLANWLQLRSFLRYCGSCATSPEGREAEMSLWQLLVWLLGDKYFARLNFWTSVHFPSNGGPLTVAPFWQCYSSWAVLWQAGSNMVWSKKVKHATLKIKKCGLDLHLSPLFRAFSKNSCWTKCSQQVEETPGLLCWPDV